MSRIPKGGAIPRPSSSRTVPPCEAAGNTSGKPKSAKISGSRSSFRTTSRTSISNQQKMTNPIPEKPKPGKKSVVEKPKPIKKLFELPPLSTMSKTGPKGPTEAEKLKKKTIRRNAPKDENQPKLKEIIKSIKNTPVNVHEFVGLVAPYTGDNANILRTVLTEDLASFRTMARRIYDTMTQDISNVLTNEHVALMESKNERFEMLSAKMLRSIDTVLEYAPDFDFESYYKNPEEYLKAKFKFAEIVVLDPEEEDMILRQEAYHRMQWLKREGDRLAAENNNLQKRLNELKRMQKAELNRKADIEREAAERKAHLEAVEADLQDKLEDLNKSVEESMIQKEKAFSAKSHVKGDMPEPKRFSKPPVRRKTSKWAVKAASEIENQAVDTALEGELSKMSVSVASKPMGGAKKKMPTKKTSKSKFKRPLPPQETSPFHYSPIKTPPRAAAPPPPEKSPFHFSPITTPPRRAPPPQAKSPFHYSPIQAPSAKSPIQESTQHYQMQDEAAAAPPRTRVERVTTVTEPIRQQEKRAVGSRGYVPKDTWGGFY